MLCLRGIAMENIEKQNSSAQKNDATHATEKFTEIDSSTMLHLQKSSFLFFLTTSIFLVFCFILTTLMPGIDFLSYYPLEMLILMGLLTFGFLIIHLNRKLAWLEPALVIAILPLTLLKYSTSIYSMCIFIIAVIELSRLGYFRRATTIKACILVSYYALSSGLIAIAHREFFLDIIMSIIFLSLFFIYFLPIIQDRWQIGKTNPIYKINLRDLNLSCREMDFLRDCLHGATFKEIAYKHHVSESTVRNTFAHIYHKFNAADRMDLLSKLAAFDIIE